MNLETLRSFLTSSKCFFTASFVTFIIFISTIHAGENSVIGAGGPLIDGGLWVNPVWLLILLLSIGCWFYLTAFVTDDSLGVGLNNHFWAGIFLSIGWLGALLIFIIHPFFALIMLLVMGGTGGFYLNLRNKYVPAQYQILASILGDSKYKKQSEAKASKKARTSDNADKKIINHKGETLQSFLAKHPNIDDNIFYLDDLFDRVSGHNLTDLRIIPHAGGYRVEATKDGVRAVIDSVEAEIGNQVVSGIIRFCRLSGNFKATSKLTYFFDDQKNIKLGVRAFKKKNGPGLLFFFPPQKSEIHKKPLSELGMDEDIADKIKDLLASPGSSIIISGPQKSGLTTTFYSAISTIDIFMNDVVIFEVKNEGELDQVKRIEVDLNDTESFKEVFPAVMREEPDVLGADGISNSLVANSLLDFAADNGRMAATLKGDSVAKVLSLLSKKLDAELLSNSLKLITNQRLMRRLCFECKEEIEPDPRLMSKLKINPQNPGNWFRPVGCEKCLGIGYDGLFGVFETLIVNDAVRNILVKDNEITPKKILKAAGGTQAYRNHEKNAISKFQDGETTFQELKRVFNF